MPDPTQRGRRALWWLAGIFGAPIALVFVGAAFVPDRTPEEAAAKAAEDQMFRQDYQRLRTAGAQLAGTNLVSRYEISGFNSSLDVYIGSSSPQMADAAAAAICDNLRGLTLQWSARVFSPDGKVAAQCRLPRSGRKNS